MQWWLSLTSIHKWRISWLFGTLYVLSFLVKVVLFLWQVFCIYKGTFETKKKKKKKKKKIKKKKKKTIIALQCRMKMTAVTTTKWKQQRMKRTVRTQIQNQTKRKKRNTKRFVSAECSGFSCRLVLVGIKLQDLHCFAFLLFPGHWTRDGCPQVAHFSSWWCFFL